MSQLDAEGQDLRQLADDTGRSLDEVTRDQFGGVEFGDWLGTLEMDYRTSYSEAAWDDGTGAGPWVAFKGDPGADALAGLESVPREVTVFTDAQLSAEERSSATGAVVAGFSEDFPDLQAVAEMIPRTTRVVLHADADISPEAVEAWAARASSVVGIPVTVEVFREDVDLRFELQ